MQSLIAAALSSIAFSQKQGQMNTVETRGEVPYRVLGKTGVHVSLVGLGGFHIGQESVTEQQSLRLIRTAIDRGINFMHNSWDYHNGGTEIRMGKALQERYPDQDFLITNICAR